MNKGAGLEAGRGSGKRKKSGRQKSRPSIDSHLAVAQEGTIQGEPGSPAELFYGGGLI